MTSRSQFKAILSDSFKPYTHLLSAQSIEKQTIGTVERHAANVASWLEAEVAASRFDFRYYPKSRHPSENVGFSLFYVRYFLLPQPVDATHVLNLSAGVSKPSVLRGRSFS